MGWVVLHLSYWLFLGLSAWFLCLTVQENIWKRTGCWLVKQGPWVWGALLGLTALLCAHERFLFKINFDEHVLLGVSRNMHYEHVAGWSTEGRLYWGTVTPLVQSADKRPVFYPFVLSLCHNFSGYRPANAFVLNMGLSFIALLGCYRLGYLISGRWSGILFAALLAGVPLLAQNATSGGFDLLNLTLIIWLGVAVAQYLREPSLVSLCVVTFVAIFLANTRYESIIYTLVPCICWLLGRLKVRSGEGLGSVIFGGRGTDFPWVLVLLPVGAMPALFSNGVFNSTEAFFQMTRQEYWNISNFAPNLQHAVAYLFDPDRGTTNSLLLALLGIIAFVAMPLAWRREWQKKRSIEIYAQCWFIIGGFVLLNVVMKMGLGWGSWDDPLVSRFTLPFWFLLAWTLTMALAYIAKSKVGSGSQLIFKYAAFLALGKVVFFAAPDASAAKATNKLQPAFMLARSLEFIQQYDPWRKSLIVAGSSLPYLNYGYAAMPIHSVQRLPQAIKYNLYENVIVVFHYKRNALTGEWEGDLTMKPFEGATFENLKDIHLDPFNLIVIARVISMDYAEVPDWIPSTDDESAGGYGKRIYQMLP